MIAASKIRAAKNIACGHAAPLCRRQVRSRRTTFRVLAFRDDAPVTGTETPSPLKTRGSTKSVLAAKQWLHAYVEDTQAMDSILALDCVQHPDDMWLPSPTSGLHAIKQQANEFKKSVLGYSIQVLEAATGVDTHGGGVSDFIFWRGSGTDASTSRVFTHLGLERHHRKHRGGKVSDIFVYSGPTVDQAESLLIDSKTPFDDSAWEPVPVMTDMDESGLSMPTGFLLTNERKYAMDASAAVLMGLLSGTRNIPSFQNLQQHLTHTITLQEETRVWDSHGMHRVHGIAELVARVSEMNAWVRADEGFPKVLSKAYTDDGLHMFVHSENVTHDVRSGLRSAAHGMLLIVFDPMSNHEDSARISRVISCRGPASSSEKARYFDVLGKKARDAAMHCEAHLKAARESLKTKAFLSEGVSVSALADGPEAVKETSTEESVEDSSEESGEVSGTVGTAETVPVMIRNPINSSRE